MSLALPAPYRVEDLAFDARTGLIPAVVQDARTSAVLMLGYCDAGAVQAMLSSGLATFYSRSRQQRWVKGETSGNTLRVTRIEVDCDQDTLLVHAEPAGPTCHTGQTSCFTDAPAAGPGFLPILDALVAARDEARPPGSYTTALLDAGVRRVAQKVGEEGVETALAAVAQDDEHLVGESADLMYHLLVLLRSRGLGLGDVEAVLRSRHS
ncbi:MAG: bifunctional phosphoribosyl-AMP cyclohydrolase/phosphoribosyl-ATP diphosphatase HisIE [Ornithinimicrobium sp.]